MAIYYSNLGNDITQQQAQAIGKFQKNFTSDNGILNKIENYRDNELKSITYYRDINETDDTALQELSAFNVTLRIRTRENYGSYTMEKQNTYLNSQLVKKGRSLKSGDGYILCEENLNVNTNQPVYDDTRKYLGKYGEDDPDYCRFRYKSDGSFWFCEYNYMDEYDNDDFEIDRLPEIKDRFQLSDAMYNYYLTAELLPPL